MLEIIDRAGSTNTLLAERAAELPHGYAVMARSQTAGRGQRGNSWESEPGANITMSVLLRPQDLDVARSFLLSEAVAMAVVDLLDPLVGDVGTVAVKWPNDIYVGSRKICGILIENSLSSRLVARSIVGLGINVNQSRFLSSAPNPVSLTQLTGETYSPESLARQLVSLILRPVESAETLHRTYLSRLWRRDGTVHPFALPSGERFMASIDDVLPSGHLVLRRHPDGMRLTFAFKEVAFVLG